MNTTQTYTKLDAIIAMLFYSEIGVGDYKETHFTIVQPTIQVELFIKKIRLEGGKEEFLGYNINLIDRISHNYRSSFFSVNMIEEAKKRWMLKFLNGDKL